jgi:hypothetical protein
MPQGRPHDSSLRSRSWSTRRQPLHLKRESYHGSTAHPCRQAAVIPYLYIDKVFNELRDELLTAMHKAVDAEMRNGRVDVQRLFRSFTRAAAKQMANPVQVSEKCVEANSIRSKKGSSVRSED